MIIKFFKHVGSLGDAFVINGLVNTEFTKGVDKLIYLCNPKHLETLETLYKENPKISLVTDENVYNEMKRIFIDRESLYYSEISSWQYITTDIDPEQRYWINWDRQIYEFYNIPYSVRYKNFQFPFCREESKALFRKLVAPGEKYIVRHAYMNSLHETFVDFNIAPYNPENLRVIDITPDLSSNFLDYVDLLKHAEQIHVTPSSVFCLVDSIHKIIPGDKYLHMVRKDYHSQYNSFLNKFCWKPVLYPANMKR